LGDGVAQIIGGRRKLIWAFLASLLGIGAIVEIWSLSHWFYSGFVPLAGYEKTWLDLEMNLRMVFVVSGDLLGHVTLPNLGIHCRQVVSDGEPPQTRRLPDL